ncbi:hypothetical protein MCP_1603 [Methanocella paludicola SANAE]|uniref:Uncharacterized protein n=1 Tax=Methanocella paludicola (strain DSM 17711 / JCM 13418 / NBRC 101707 / SANAE) TaxID=304371 RepID=D1YZ03_METPS|nr:hypothetical protein [Methanocella paludicola]BAI61675.1 hypothetical protein MCP_1603 [Methanocella paludicola SANAE]
MYDSKGLDAKELIKKINESIAEDLEQLADERPIQQNFSNNYSDLQIACQYITNHESNSIFSKLENNILLAYSIEISKRFCTSFWREFFEQLNMDENSYKQVKIHDNLCKRLDQIGIQVEKNKQGSRLLVGTLRLLTEANIKPAIDFCIKYYKNYYLKNRKEKFHDIFNLYSHDTNEYELYEVVNEKLTKIFDYIKDNIDIIDIDNDEDVVEKIKNNTNINIKNIIRAKISTLYSEIFNNYTPIQFKSILRNNRDNNVICPDTKTVKCGSLEDAIIDYGVYSINENEYTITPSIKISINDMAQWPCCEICNKNGLYYYKKDEEFSVYKGNIPQMVRAFVNNGEKQFIWCGNITVGEEYLVDGISYRSEGFSWNPDLKMMWGQNNELPFLQIEIPKIAYYDENNSRKKIQINIEDEIKELKIGSDGSLVHKNFYFKIEKMLKSNKFSINMSASIRDNDFHRNQIIDLEDNMLFSGSTRNRIVSQYARNEKIKRNFGDDRYYLFTIADKEDIIVKTSIEDAKVEKSEDEEEYELESITYLGDLSRYHIYEIAWTYGDNLIIKAGNCNWKFERKSFLEWQFESPDNVFSSISDIQISGFCNSNNDLEDGLYYRILDDNYDEISRFADNGVTINGLHFYINGKIILKDCAIDNNLEEGEYVFEILAESTTYSKKFYIVPKIFPISWPSMLIEGEKSVVRIESDHPVIIDPVSNKEVERVDFEIYGKAIESSLDGLIIEEAPISVKVGFKNPSVIRTFSPLKVPYLFAYRLYRKDKKSLNLIKEAEYNSLEDTILYVYGIPDMFVVLKIDGQHYKSKRIDTKGYVKFDELKDLYRFCKSSETSVSICLQYDLNAHTAVVAHKIFKVIWNPETLSIAHDEVYLGNNIKANICSKGPSDKKITVMLRTPTMLLEKQDIQCTGKEESNEICFKLEKKVEDTFLYLETYYSYNDILLKSKYAIINNGLIIPIEIENGAKTIISVSDFYKNIISIVQDILYQEHKTIIRLSNTSLNKIQLMILNILIALDSSYDVVIPDSARYMYYSEIKNICGRENLIVLKNSAIIDKVENVLSFNIQQQSPAGIGASSINLLENTEYIFSRPLIFIDCQDLKLEDKKAILEYHGKRKIIMIEKKIKT